MKDELRLNPQDLQKIIKDSEQSVKNLENYDKGEYFVDVEK